MFSLTIQHSIYLWLCDLGHCSQFASTKEMTKARHMKLSQKIDIWSKTLQWNLLIKKIHFSGKFSLTSQSKHRESRTSCTRTNHWLITCSTLHSVIFCLQWKLWVWYLPTGIFMWNYTTFCNISCNSSGFSMLKNTLYFIIQSRHFLLCQYEKNKSSNKSIHDSTAKSDCHRMLKVKKSLNIIRSDRMRTFSLFHISEYAADMEIGQHIGMYK